jgi:serine/threonine protein kinase
MELSVQHLCNLISRQRLMTPNEVRALYYSWNQEAGPAAADVNLFGKWLVARKHLTDYQVAILLGRRQERLWIGPYKVLTRVGQGRMAGVYRAANAQGQIVALKLLPPSKATDPVLLARFQRESRLALRFKHPNVVRTFEAGQDQGQHFLAMELLQGETLTDVLRRRGRLPPRESLRLLYQALSGLQHLHDEGVVHRDLDPGNLMLVPDGSSPEDETTLHSTVKILDIGLGRALFDEGAPGEANLVTAAGASIGKPDYQAPEQHRNAHQVDIRADLYSLGCVLYHLLVGEPPFADKNPVRVVLRHAKEPPTPLGQFGVREPPGLQGVIDGLLAKDPALRYATPGEAAQEVRRLLAACGAG